MASKLAEEPAEISNFRDQITIEPINPLKLTGYFNDILKSLLEDPKASILDYPDSSQNISRSNQSSSSFTSTPAILKLCSTFAADTSPSVIFILRDSLKEIEEIDEEHSNEGMIFFLFIFTFKNTTNHFFLFLINSFT